MTLHELSVEYQNEAQAIQARIYQLEDMKQKNRSLSREQRARIYKELRLLHGMWYDVRAVAEVTGHYYDKSYRKKWCYTV